MDTSFKVYTHHYESPLGSITIASDGLSLTGLWFDGQRFFSDTLPPFHDEVPLSVFAETDRWLDTYFGGHAPTFTPPIVMRTSPFRKLVWDIMLTIPYGQTMTYGEIAREIARKTGVQKMSAQAIGGAVGHNAIALIIPCHRVIGSDGSLTGYGGGLWRKQKLLEMEGVYSMRL